MTELVELFREMTRRDASDLHLNVTSPPQIRIRGELISVSGHEPLTKYTVRELLYSILTKEQAERLESHWEVDFSYAVPGLARFRVNAYFQRGTLGAAFRIIPEKIRPLSSLGVPDSLYHLCDLPRGIVLVTGPTGSGKSTTLASMIDVINERRSEHILTVEDPIEFIHTNKNCMVNQREVGTDTEGFAEALKSALRQDPDIILVGEMRDLETIRIALTAAETGHLVFGTLHTNSASKTIDRVVDAFPEQQQSQIRVQLASSLMGVISQSLVPTADGKGRVVACEVMIPNSAIRNLIREGKIFQLPSLMQTSQGEGMQTLDSALAALVADGTITMEEALKRCAEEAEFERMVASGAGAPPPGQYVYEPPARLRLSVETLAGEADEGYEQYDEFDAGGEPQHAATPMMPEPGMMSDTGAFTPTEPALAPFTVQPAPAASMMPSSPFEPSPHPEPEPAQMTPPPAFMPAPPADPFAPAPRPPSEVAAAPPEFIAPPPAVGVPPPGEMSPPAEMTPPPPAFMPAPPAFPPPVQSAPPAAPPPPPPVPEAAAPISSWLDGGAPAGSTGEAA